MTLCNNVVRALRIGPFDPQNLSTAELYRFRQIGNVILTWLYRGLRTEYVLQDEYSCASLLEILFFLPFDMHRVIMLSGPQNAAIYLLDQISFLKFLLIYAQSRLITVVSSPHMSERAEAANPYHCKPIEGLWLAKACVMASKGVCLHAIELLRMLYAGKVDAANLLKSLDRRISEPGIVPIRYSIEH